MASGYLRTVHRTVLSAVLNDAVVRGADYEYRVDGRGRHVSEAVYLLESMRYVELRHDGRVAITNTGAQYLLKHINASMFT